ncbi:MAG: nickel-dependent lactate racemase [Candidatus Odinarchaeia archaeon]
MEIDIPLGNICETIKIEDKNLLEVVYPRKVEKLNELEVLKKAFENPIGSKSFKEFINENPRFMIVVNDIYRSTPTSKILSYIMDNIKEKDFKVIIATGSHRPPTEIEIRKITGDKFYEKFKDRILYHDSKKDEHVYLGKSKFGTDIYIDKRVIEYGAAITINSIEPHYFAGFTGGRKSIIPGIASYETITQNHSLALRSEAKLTKLKGNPVNEDMEDIIRRVLNKINIFAINLVTDFDLDIYACATGDIIESFYKLIDVAKKVYCVKVKEKADIVVTIAKAPLDINLYQSQKALESAKLAVKKGGVIILVSSCSEGIGPSNFYDLLTEFETPDEIFAKIEKEYKLGYHKTAKLIEAGRLSGIFIVSHLDMLLLQKTFIKPFKTVNDALKEALNRVGGDGKILFLMDGGLIAPIVGE